MNIQLIDQILWILQLKTFTISTKHKEVAQPSHALAPYKPKRAGQQTSQQCFIQKTDLENTKIIMKRHASLNPRPQLSFSMLQAYNIAK